MLLLNSSVGLAHEGMRVLGMVANRSNRAADSVCTSATGDRVGWEHGIRGCRGFGRIRTGRRSRLCPHPGIRPDHPYGALAEARKAADGYSEVGEGKVKELAGVEAFLAEHGGGQ
jgi:hypothetical protein